MMNFTKVHALGNDFLLVEDNQSIQADRLPDLTRQLCERHTGVGADGLILIKVLDFDQSRVSFRIFNADGSEAEISGNGLRCASAVLFHYQKVPEKVVKFETIVGEHLTELISQDNNHFDIRTDMGQPRFSSKDIPFDDGSEHDFIVDYPLTINGKVYNVTCVSTGNPHCDIFVERFFPARIEWHQIGQEVEHHPFFPNRTNVEFIRVLNRNEIEVLFWERGVGETLASGTGACGAAVAAILKGLTERKVRVWTNLGVLTVEWEKDKLFQTGPAELVFEGRSFI
jgi:diaminopimelate epimerase